MSEKYGWVENMDERLTGIAHSIVYGVAAIVCLFRGHDYHKYTLTVCVRCNRIHP